MANFRSRGYSKSWVPPGKIVEHSEYDEWKKDTAKYSWREFQKLNAKIKADDWSHALPNVPFFYDFYLGQDISRNLSILKNQRGLIVLMLRFSDKSERIISEYCISLDASTGFYSIISIP